MCYNMMALIGWCILDFIYRDELIAVCIKPAGVLSTDEPGGMPSLVREALGEPCVRTVHRLDRVVSGLMLLALSSEAASAVSREIMSGGFRKEYLAVLHGRPAEASATLRDLLARDKRERKTYVAEAPGKGVQEAALKYSLLAEEKGLSLVKIELLTGRTHQIRAHLSHIGHPLLGDEKYGNQKLNRRYGMKRQALYAYSLALCFTSPAGSLEYLNGRVFTVGEVWFAKDNRIHI